jgi:hypothetical protein
MSRWDDSALWTEMAAATTDEERQAVAARVVEFHLGFIKGYARRTMSSAWPESGYDEYVAELVLVALTRALHYDSEMCGDRGRATFPTYLRRYLLPVRYVIDASQQPIAVNPHTIRLRIAVRYFAQQFQETHQRQPTPAETAEYLSTKRKDKETGPYQAARLLTPPSMVYADRAASEDGEQDLWNYLPLASTPDPSEAVLDDSEDGLRRELVRDLLSRVQLSDVERSLLAERIMARPRESFQGEVVYPGPATLADLGRRFGVSSEAMRKAETRLLRKLRRELEPDDPDDGQQELPMAA